MKTHRRHAPLVAGCALFAVSWLLLVHVGFWKHGEQQMDTHWYRDYGSHILDGQVPYRDFALEYPPAALPVFIVPALGNPKTEATYRTRFEWLMAICGLVAIVCIDSILRLTHTPGRLRLALLCAVGLSSLALGPVILTRYDLWPAMLSVAALATFLRGRSSLGGALLGLAAAAKFYPAVMVPVALIFVWQRDGKTAAIRAGAALVGAFAACVLPFLLLAPHGTLHPFALQFERPLQEESLGGAALIALHRLTGLKLGLETSYGSLNFGGHRATLVAAVTSAVELAALAWIWIGCLRRRLTTSSTATAAVAAVAIVLAFGKVFSPQYMIWLVPLVPVVSHRVVRQATLVFVAACGLTQSWFPRHAYELSVQLRQPYIWFLVARDLAVVSLAALLLIAFAKQRVDSDGSYSER